jgi:outer membrane protein assembly factor BamE (lipoprotein component of BamABCDE complex)
MIRRRLLLLALPAVAVSLAAAMWLLRSPTAITWANAAKVQPGMTLTEVEAILGGPPRLDSCGRVSYCLTGVEGFDPTVPRPPQWASDEVMVMVYFDADGRVQRCVPVPVRSEGQDIVAIVRRLVEP